MADFYHPVPGQAPKPRHEPIRPIYFPNSPDVILATGQQIKDERARALYYFLYVTGCRINEATDFTPSRLTKFKDFYQIKLKTLKARSAFRKFRDVIIPRGEVCRCFENKMWNDVAPFLDKHQQFQYPFRKWRNMSEYIARKVPEVTCEALVKTATSWEPKVVHKRMHPHFLRHCRATHLVIYYSIPAIPLCGQMGWANLQMALIYEQIGAKELKDYILRPAPLTDAELQKKLEAWAKASMEKGF